MATRGAGQFWMLALALTLGADRIGVASHVPGIVPAPAHLQLLSGAFVPAPEIAIVAQPVTGDTRALSELAAQIVHDGWNVPSRIHVDNVATPAIVLTLRPRANANAESYTLDVTPQRIEIVAPAAAGLFYGLQTLRQLLTPETAKTGVGALHIDDAPRFGYRGMHLDVGRHLYPVEFIERYIDLMARYKFNTFHWHLTEDQGWRLEIKRYPKLTEIGAWRKETIWGRNFDPYFGDGVRYGGFYTQAQVREIVAYATARHVTIIPEIDLPGHMKAALAAYPELACTPGPFEVSTVWGVDDDVLCPSETTFRFLEGVLSEVIEMFPSRYIHLGGDEAPTTRWRDSPLAQEIMRREHYTKEVELQGYFLRRLEKFLAARGRRLIGWDEILAGGLSPGATVMSWRGMDGGTAAARQGHDVIMTPGEFAYFDHCEGDPKRDPVCVAGGERLPLAQVYRFEPVPPELDAAQARHIIGAQANQWTEHLPTSQTVEYMNFPREFAMAEVLWSPRERRDWRDFESRLAPQLAALDRLGVRYRIPDVDGLEENVTTLEPQATLALHSPLPDAAIHYTLDGSAPNERSPRYKQPLQLNADAEGTPVSARLILPDGRKGPVSRAIVRRAIMKPALALDGVDVRPGLARAYYEHELQSTRGLAQLPAQRRDVANEIGIPAYARPVSFALAYDGYLRVPSDGLYDFRLESDDGAVLRIDGEVVIDRDGPQSPGESGGSVALAAGAHAISLKYFQDGGGEALRLRMRRGDAAPQPLPAAVLEHRRQEDEP